jgi:putative inorganic carbon (hco3(-)) transporter
LLIFAVAPPEYWARMETIKKTDEGTAQLRQNYWLAARRMFADSPIWGVGGGNGQVLMPEYALEFSDEYRPNQWGRAFHSFYYQILAEFGSLGVLLIGSIVVLNFRDLRQIRALARQGRVPSSLGHLANCLRFSWIGFFVCAAFISVLTYPHLYYLTALTVSLRRFAREQEELSPAAEQASVVPVRRGPLWGSRLPEPGR